jgi:hypothetical protein
MPLHSVCRVRCRPIRAMTGCHISRLLRAACIAVRRSNERPVLARDLEYASRAVLLAAEPGLCVGLTAVPLLGCRPPLRATCWANAGLPIIQSSAVRFQTMSSALGPASRTPIVDQVVMIFRRVAYGVLLDVTSKEPCDAISSEQARGGDTPGAKRSRTVADQCGVVEASYDFGRGRPPCAGCRATGRRAASPAAAMGDTTLHPYRNVTGCGAA